MNVIAIAFTICTPSQPANKVKDSLHKCGRSDVSANVVQMEWCFNIKLIITARKRSCGKVLFYQACVSHSVHRGRHVCVWGGGGGGGGGLWCVCGWHACVEGACVGRGGGHAWLMGHVWWKEAWMVKGGMNGERGKGVCMHRGRMQAGGMHDTEILSCFIMFSCTKVLITDICRQHLNN